METPLKLIVEDIVFGPLLFLLFLLLALLLMLPHRRQFKLPFLLLFSGWIFLLLGSNTLFFQFIAYPLKQLTPISVTKKHTDAIVVASAGVHESGAPTQGSALRAYTAARLYLEKQAPTIIVTGGVTHPYQPPVSIKGMAIILQGMGVPQKDIIIEDRSTDTYQNGIESVKILNQRNMKTILLVSHDYHLFRLVSVFEKLGIESYPYAANRRSTKGTISWWRYFDWENFNRLQTIAHEYMGLLTYKLTDRI